MRRLISPARTAAAAAGLLLLSTGTAAAHVSVSAHDAQQGAMAVATFQVPTESQTAATTGLTIAVPNLARATTEPVPGWTASVERNDEAEVTSVSWSANPGTPGIAPGQFQRFAVALGPLPTDDTVSFPTTQTYSDGEVVSWDQPVGGDGSEPQHPAPTLELAEGASPAGGGDHHRTMAADQSATADTGSDTDTTARWLGGIGLALGLIGAGLGLGAVLRNRGGQGKTS